MDSGDISTQLTVRLWRNSKFQKLLKKLEVQMESTNLVFCLSLELESEKKNIQQKKDHTFNKFSVIFFFLLSNVDKDDEGNIFVDDDDAWCFWEVGDIA